MLEQLHLYALCFILGWAPLYFFYRKLEQSTPLPIEPSKATFSIIPLLYLIYIGLEIARAYFLLHVAHEWLAFDIDLLVGLMLYLTGVGFPIFIPKTYRTPLCLSIFGIYLYLFPKLFWIIPTGLAISFFMQVSPKKTYALLGSLFIIFGWIHDGNSLYMMVYLGLLLYLVIKTFPATPNHATKQFHKNQ